MALTPTTPRRAPRRGRSLRRFAGASAAGLTLVVAVAACGSDTSSSAAGGGAPADSGGGGNAVAIKNFAFAPGTLTVKVGTMVTFTNQDSATHTATADDKSFDSKNLDQNKTFSTTFSKAGTIKYHCDIHQYMTGTITVTG